MNDRTPDELDDVTRRAVQAWCGEPEPAWEDALGRLRRAAVGRPPGVERTWRLAPALVAAALALAFLAWVPSAVAALAETVRQPLHAAAAPSADPNLRAAWRPVLVVHVACLTLGYLFFLFGWGAAQLDVFLRLFSLRGLSQWGPRLSPVGAALGASLWLAGVVLGAWWASANLGRAWGWDAREVGGLVTVAAGAVWWRLGRQVQGAPGVWPAAVAAAWLWVVVYAYWYSAIADGRAHGFRRSGLFIDVGAAQNALLLAAAWVAERFRRTAA